MPAALAGLALALGPLLIHLLQRRQARRAVVPTVRFVPPVSHSSLRLRAPDDVLLLVLRTTAIVVAVLALAGPVILTESRTAGWSGRIVRAVVVDTSPSAAAATGDERIAAALVGAYAARRFEARHLSDGVKRAAGWLESAPPGRREIVVASDFQLGSLSATAFAALPAGTGIRFAPLDTPSGPGAIERGVEYYDGVPHHRDIALDGLATTMTLSRGGATEPGLRIEGADGEQAARLERIVRDAGFVSSRPDGKVLVRFGGTAEGSRPAAADASAVLLRLLRNEALTGLAFSARADGDTLVVTTDIDPSSLEAATLVHAATGAWRDPDAYAEVERERIAEETLQAWTREAAPADPSAWRHVQETDARWFWSLALLCLAGEWLLRRRVPADRERPARAA